MKKNLKAIQDAKKIFRRRMDQRESTQINLFEALTKNNRRMSSRKFGADHSADSFSYDFEFEEQLEDYRDSEFMENVAQYLKLSPEGVHEQSNEFLRWRGILYS